MASSSFLPYHEPSTTHLLVLVSFLLFLPLSTRLFQKFLHAGLLGPLALGIIYGVPLGNILPNGWQETFLALGYLGLIIIVLEGGLTTSIDLLRQNLVLSLLCALTGIGAPIGLSMALLGGAFGYSTIESFVLGAALSATSLGTTFAILSAAKGESKEANFAHTRVGTVIMSAAMIDDVVGLIMASVIQSLGSTSETGASNVGWTIGRPILVAALMTVLTPLITKYLLEPVHRRWLYTNLRQRAAEGQFVLLVLLASAFCAVASYAGTSILYGAYLAGTVMAYIDSTPTLRAAIPGPLPMQSPHPTIRPNSPEETLPPAPLSFHDAYSRYLAPLQKPLFEPLFFASIGFAIPFRDVWAGRALWRGIVYALLMCAGKLVVGLWIPLYALSPRLARASLRALRARRARAPLAPAGPVEASGADTAAAALLLGAAMVARGEIGLLILQIGYNQSGKVSHEGFVLGNWAVVLNTVVGPVVVGVLVKRLGAGVVEGPWGVPQAR